MRRSLTVLWHKEPDSWADHAGTCVGAGHHLHTVGGVEFRHFHEGHSGVSVYLKLHRNRKPF